MAKPLFFVKRGDRLIARLKHLLYAWRFAREAGGRVIMIWPGLPGFWHQFDGSNYSPSLIFDLGELYRRGGSDDLVFVDGQWQFPIDGKTLRAPEYDAMRNNRFERDVFKEPGLVFYEPNLMPYCFKDEKLLRPTLNAQISALYRALPLTLGVRRPLEAARKALGADGYAALHVRRGDIYEMLRRELPAIADAPLSEAAFKRLMGHYVVRTAPLEMYLPHVERAVASGRKIAFFSDSPETFAWFAQRLGARHFVDGKTFVAEQPLQKAMLDFAVMTDAAQIISTRSNYGALAADIGGVEHVIVSAQSYSTMNVDQAINLYYRQLIDQFVPKLPDKSAGAQSLHAEIRRLYLWVNRLPGDHVD